MYRQLFLSELTLEPKYYVESSAAAEQQGLVSLCRCDRELCY
jgi:hypothetical protein